MTEQKTVFQLFNELIEGMKQAEGACSQLIHRSGHPAQFMIYRDALRFAIDGCMKVAPHNILMMPKTVYMGKA